MKKRISMILKLYNNGKMVSSERFTLNSRVIAQAQRELWQNGYIKVSYAKQYYNHADFSSVEQLKELLSVFTEKAMTDGFCLSK